MNSTREKIGEGLNIIWAIASKDIADAIKSRLVFSIIVMSIVMLLVPKMMPLIFEQPATGLTVYDPGKSSLVAALRKAPHISLRMIGSVQELGSVLCNGLFPELGLVIPADFDQTLAAGGQVELKGYTCWRDRFEVAPLQSKLEGQLTPLAGRTVHIITEGNIVYPSSNSGLALGLVTINVVVVFLLVGIALVPSLMLEEKQNKTMAALMVSPASISQVVVGKALAGMFYIMVIGAMVFAISWAEVTHWGVAILFVLAAGGASVAIGLVMGSLLESAQDLTGWMSMLLIVFVGAVFVRVIGLETPDFVQVLLSWVPSVALAELCRAAFIENVSFTHIAGNLGIVMAIALPLYGFVALQVRRYDR